MHHSVSIMNIHFTGDTAPSDILLLPQSWSQAASQWSSYESVALIVKGSECWQHAKNFKRQQLKFFFFFMWPQYTSPYSHVYPHQIQTTVSSSFASSKCAQDKQQHDNMSVPIPRKSAAIFFPLTSNSLTSYHSSCSSSFSPPLSGGGINTMVGGDCRSEQAKVWTLCRLVDKEADDRTDPESWRRRRMARNVNFDLSHHVMEAGLE